MCTFSYNLHKMHTFQENARILCKLDENGSIFWKMRENARIFERPLLARVIFWLVSVGHPFHLCAIHTNPNVVTILDNLCITKVTPQT